MSIQIDHFSTVCQIRFQSDSLSIFCCSSVLATKVVWHLITPCFSKKFTSPLTTYFNINYIYTWPYVYPAFRSFSGLSNFWKWIMHEGFAWNRKCILLGVKQPGCVVSILSWHLKSYCLSISGSFRLFLTDVPYIFDHHTGTCRIKT